MRTPHLLVHNPKDNVGVVVVEGLKAGTEMFCVITETNADFQLVANVDIPIGHTPPGEQTGHHPSRRCAPPEKATNHNTRQ